jgi:hypothetical protein
VYTLFPPYSSSYLFPHHLPHPTGVNPSTLGRTYFALMFSDFYKKKHKRYKEKQGVFAGLR